MADVRLQRLDELVAERLLEAAVADADPLEVMPPVAGPGAWTSAHKEAFRSFLRERRACEPGELSFAVIVDHEVLGFTRLDATDRPGVRETGIWLARSARGRGIGTATIAAVLDEARALGVRTVVAETTPDNLGSQGMLRRNGARLEMDVEAGTVYASIAI